MPCFKTVINTYVLSSRKNFLKSSCSGKDIILHWNVVILDIKNTQSYMALDSRIPNPNKDAILGQIPFYKTTFIAIAQQSNPKTDMFLNFLGMVIVDDDSGDDGECRCVYVEMV